jgi:hypothetical protein
MKMKKKLMMLVAVLMMGLAAQTAQASVWEDEMIRPCNIVYQSPRGGYVIAAGVNSVCIYSPWSVCWSTPCEPIVIGHPHA